MTQKSIVLIALLLFAQFVFSQEEPTETSSKATLGINLGGNLFSTRGANHFPNNFDSKIDFLIGINFVQQLKSNLYFKTNLNYERNTVGIDTETLISPTGPAEDLSIRHTMHVLSVPLFLKRSFGEKEAFYINGGGFVNFLFSETGKLNGESVNFEWGSTFKTFNAGAGIGFGTVLFFDDKNSLDIELRNNLGLLNISKLNSTVRTNTLSLIATWNFDL